MKKVDDAGELQQRLLKLEKTLRIQSKQMGACRKQAKHARLNNELLLSTIEQLKEEVVELRQNCADMPEPTDQSAPSLAPESAPVEQPDNTH